MAKGSGSFGFKCGHPEDAKLSLRQQTRSPKPKEHLDEGPEPKMIWAECINP